MIIDVIIPAYNEEKSIGLVIADLPNEIIRHIIICNNGSTDNTKIVALSCGAHVIDIPSKGYGNACLGGISYLSSLAQKPDIVVFLDGDYSDYPQEIIKLVDPILTQEADIVIGSRSLGNKEKDAMMPQQVFGNWLATRMIALLYRYRYTDLGPFRAISWLKLLELNMCDRNFGWTVEMQIKAIKNKLRILEIPVSYRVRIGKSKVSGTLSGTIGAGYKILYTIIKYSISNK